MALHGHEYELHDDFYDDCGKAYAAQEPVEEDAKLVFPALSTLSNNVNRLVDYALVKWWYPPSVTPYLQSFEPLTVLQQLDAKIALNPFLLPKCLEIAAHSLGPHAYAWVKFQLNNYEGFNELLFAEAVAACFPNQEAESFVLGALNKLDEKALAQQITCLCYFNGNGPLDWMETHCRNITVVSSNYGFASAALGITWDRAKRWLMARRPLSLIALDALVNCGATAETANAPLWLREHPPHLHMPDTIAAMDDMLTQYLALDSVPRTKNAVRFIKEHWPQILKQQQPN
ncbi:hypothetical protein GCM10027345_15910 [Hymenobacter daeguensis]